MRRAFLGFLLCLLPHAALAQAPPAEQIHSKYSEQHYAELKTMVDAVNLGDMDVAFFKKAYHFDHATDMLKAIFSDPVLQAKSNRLAELRKFYDWSIQADFARDHFVTIENTNQGKANGARSDLDATANILDFDPVTRKWGIQGRVKELIDYHRQRYAADGLTPEGTDVSLFDGDAFLPDWRDARLGLHEYTVELLRNVAELRAQKGAYYVPGANKEQTHDRALAEGHTVHIGWDHVANLPSINGRPIAFNSQTGEVVWLKASGEGKSYERGGPVEELITREAAVEGDVARYAGVAGLPPGERWRRALGNIVQNTKEFFEPHDPVGRNKYFIERLIDQGVGRFTHLDPAAFDTVQGPPENLPEAERPPPTYVQIHEAESKGRDMTAWKQAYIQQSFNLAQGDPKIEELRKVLDHSADIQLDKIRGRASYVDHAKFSAGDKFYFRDEWAEAVKNIEQQLGAAAASKPEADITRLREQEAERLFVEKQRRIIPEAAVKVVEQTFLRELYAPRNGRFLDPEVQKKLRLERGVEIALLLEVVESSPLPDAGAALRERVMKAVPPEVQKNVEKIAKLVALEMDLAGRKDLGFGENQHSPQAEIIQELESQSAELSLPSEKVKENLRSAVRMRLGPFEGDQFDRAWSAGKKALIAKFGAKAYLKEMTDQLDGMMVTGAALGMIQAYQRDCIDQADWNEACVTGLASETFNQAMYMLPVVNTGMMITGGLKQLAAGQAEGAVSVGLGVFSIPQIGAMVTESGGGTFIHVFVGYQMLKAANAVTFGYAEQKLKTDLEEQAFKAVADPGVPVKAFPSPNRSSLFTAPVPDYPLLSDVTSVPADKLTEAQRTQTALHEAAAAIEGELKQLHLDPGTAEFKSKKTELATRYGMLMPYLQRTAKIYQVFGPKVAARGAEASRTMPDCLDKVADDVQRKYSEPPGILNQLSYWWNPGNIERDRQRDLSTGWNECVDKAIQADEKLLTPVFNSYVQTWADKQSAYRALRAAADDDDDDGGERGPSEFVLNLSKALMREYVVHRYIDQGYESERQMKTALSATKEQTKTKLSLMGKVLDGRQAAARQIGEQLSQSVSNPGGGDKVQLTLRAPPFAVRAGAPALLDVSARVLSSAASTPAKNDEWKTDLGSEVVKVSLGAPENIIVTPELRQELTPEPGKKPKRLVTIEETITGQLKNPSGATVASAKTAATSYAVIDWQGALSVEVRAAGPDTKDVTDSKQTSAYPYALVKLSGPSQATKESEPSESGGWAGAGFVPVPEGKYLIRVEPRSSDLFRKPAETSVDLTGITMGKTDSGEPAILVGGPKEVTVVLPYLPPPARTTRNDPPPARTAAPLPPVTVPAANVTSRPKDPDPPAPDPQIKRLGDVAAQQENGCDYSAAILSLRQLAAVDPANPALAGLPRLERLAAAKANIESLLADAETPANDAEAAEILARLRQSQGDAPPCLGPEIATAIASLEHRLAIRGRITAAIAACDYVKAVAAALELQAIAPDDGWLAANLSQLQAVAAAQSSALTLIQQAQSSSGPEAAALAGRLRQALTSAPACMAGQIQTAIASLEQGQKPAWLDAGSQTVKTSSPSENLNHARDILQHTTQDEAQHQTRAQNQAKPPEPPVPTQPPPKANEPPPAKPEPRRRDPQRTQETINTLAATIGTILSGGQIPLPVPAGGASARGPADPFAGTWSCRGTITSQRNTKAAVGNPVTEIRISKSGAGYVLDSRAGPVASTSVSGNHITFSVRVGRADSWQAVSDDLFVTGNHMTGTERSTNSDGAEVVGALDCTRR